MQRKEWFREFPDVAWPHVARRVLRMRLRTAIVVALPAVLLCAWYVWRVEGLRTGYRVALGNEVPKSVDVFQLLLHDVIERDVRVLSMNREVSGHGIRRFNLSLTRRNRAQLVESAGKDGKRPYVEAKMHTKGGSQEVKVQVRGDQPWQLLGASRTMRVRLPAGELFDGNRTFNLLNDTSPFVVGDDLVLDIARSLKVLSPKTSFARVSMNGKDLGVFHYETQPDESLLRAWRRVPGSMYAGDLKRGMETQSLWSDPSTWKKHAWKNGEDKKNRRELTRLLAMITGASVEDFAEYARREINLEAYARFEAIDIAFGSEQRDFRHNHRLYFDPYRGRWEPVAWRFSGFKHAPAFDLVESPLLLRLKQVPEYPTLLAATLYELLTGEASVDEVRELALRRLESLTPELRADRDWYAEHLLPRADEFHRDLLRPMTVERAALMLASEIETYARRHAYLMRELTANPLQIVLGKQEPSGAQRGRLQIRGRSGVRIERVGVSLAAGCSSPSWSVRLGGKTLVAHCSAHESTLSVPVELQPAFGVVPRNDPEDKNGGIRFVPATGSFDLDIHASCEVVALTLNGSLLATGSAIHTRASATAVDSWPSQPGLDPKAVPTYDIGEPPSMPEPRWSRSPRTLRLGPGVVDVADTREFGEDEVVEVVRGTRLRMGPGASLVFLGQVKMLGTAEDPVVIEGDTSVSWGGDCAAGARHRWLRAVPCACAWWYGPFVASGELSSHGLSP